MDENKTELFKFLSQQLACMPVAEGKVIYVTYGINVLSTHKDASIQNLAPCTHEEADTHLLLHAADATEKCVYA